MTTHGKLSMKVDSLSVTELLQVRSDWALHLQFLALSTSWKYFPCNLRCFMNAASLKVNSLLVMENTAGVFDGV